MEGETGCPDLYTEFGGLPLERRRWCIKKRLAATLKESSKVGYWKRVGVTAAIVIRCSAVDGVVRDSHLAT